jgi:ankyrin repeat protein
MNIFSKNPERCCYILDLLIFNGANINERNDDQWAPLHTAIRKGQDGAVKAIIKLNRKIIKHN